MKTRHVNTLVIGTGAAGLCAALRLYREGVRDLLAVTEGLSMGTSINTGSDKQTYYKLNLCGAEPDSPVALAGTYAVNGAVHGDIALVESALSVRGFLHLCDLGVPFPHDALGSTRVTRPTTIPPGGPPAAGPTPRRKCASPSSGR